MSVRNAALAATLLAILAALGSSACGWAAPPYKLFIMPKLVGIQYFDVVKQGVDEAARELSQVRVSWTGPSQDMVEKQIEMIEKVIPEKPDVIAVSANDPGAIAPVLRKAHAAGIHVMSWDADSDFREFFVNPADFDSFTKAVVSDLIAETGGKGELAVVTTSFTAPNQSTWIKGIKERLYAEAPGLRIVDIRAAGESTEEAYRIAQDYLKVFPGLKGIIALGAPNLPGVARAVKEAGLAGKVAVTGTSTPNLMRGYLKDGTVRNVVLWNVLDHGYLVVYAALALAEGKLAPGKPFSAGRLGTLTPTKDGQNMQISLPVLVFTTGNVDQYDF